MRFSHRGSPQTLASSDVKIFQNS